MLERRQHTRDRVYYGGVVAYEAQGSTLACLVRNFSGRGARIEFEGTSLLPREVDFTIERRSFACRARLVWRERDVAGLEFYEAEKSGVIPLELARKLHANERANRQLRLRIERILNERQSGNACEY